MYQIDETRNKINRLKEETFSDLGFKEREHLQEWISKDPDCLGEELLIIQKEFDGFQDTRERLDLLAIDKQGNLVIIENKLDDSGKDVTWQVIKYASYCSSLSKDDIRSIFQDYLKKSGQEADAEENLAEFLDKEDFSEVLLNQGAAQRIIMIAAQFRKEVTSTVLWLMNFNIRIQCFKVTPYTFGDQLFLNFDQILPVVDAQEYSISMASKAQEEIATQENLKQRHHIRLEFWRKFLGHVNRKNSLFSNISPSKENWLGTGIGMSGLSLNMVVSGKYARAELFINRETKEESKTCFDYLYSKKDQIENDFGDSLVWERKDQNKTCRIKAQKDGLSLYDKEDWDEMIEHMSDVGERMEKALRNPVKQLNVKIKRGDL
ncbi:DUF4268 domain-containing protein [Rhodohalobacter sp. SW132]|uniref:DUF4268 domain-containing protein n=1 Tax=Rhodohalobacter sp. SW132 TaxID=2293433 RepID=UPI000E21CC99|nr:DUF4268 domain-containing protein [Rhodohalobacter sp. SW132]REL32986.1 DUF4268 domain-containing protein [Rhodohalobacter sp. SW132]